MSVLICFPCFLSYFLPDLFLKSGSSLFSNYFPIFLIPIGITLIFSATCPEIAKKQLNNAIKHAPSAYEKIKNGCKKIKNDFEEKLENNSKKDSNPILEKDLEENKKENMENK